VRSVLVDNAHDVGVAAFASDLTLENSLVRNTQPDVALMTFGRGIDLEVEPTADDPPARAVVRQCVVSGNHEAGVFVSDSELDAEALVIRDSLPTMGRFGRGLSAELDPATNLGSRVTLRFALLDNNREVAVNIADSSAVLESVLVRNTQTQDGERGRGINVQTSTTVRSQLDLIGSEIADNHEFGVLVVYADATIRSTAIRGTRPQPADGLYGDGLAIIALPGVATASISLSRIADSQRAGIGNFGAFVAMESNDLACNLIQLDGEAIATTNFEFDDRAGNVCRCEAIETCKVVSTMLQPPRAL